MRRLSIIICAIAAYRFLATRQSRQRERTLRHVTLTETSNFEGGLLLSIIPTSNDGDAICTAPTSMFMKTWRGIKDRGSLDGDYERGHGAKVRRCHVSLSIRRHSMLMLFIARRRLVVAMRISHARASRSPRFLSSSPSDAILQDLSRINSTFCAQGVDRRIVFSCEIFRRFAPSSGEKLSRTSVAFLIFGQCDNVSTLPQHRENVTLQ